MSGALRCPSLFGPGKKFVLDKFLKVCYNNNTNEKGKNFPKKILNFPLTFCTGSAIIKVQRKRERGKHNG